MGKMVKVGMADMNICSPPDAITTLGLGSCVGVVLYDQKISLAGMVHVMLPDSTIIKTNENVAKFADSGVKALIDLMVKSGASKHALIAKIAGGAQMFAFNTNNNMLRVGERNVLAVKSALMANRIKLVAEDTGANYGRTIEFYPSTGELVIKSVGKPEKRI